MGGVVAQFLPPASAASIGGSPAEGGEGGSERSEPVDRLKPRPARQQFAAAVRAAGFFRPFEEAAAGETGGVEEAGRVAHRSIKPVVVDRLAGIGPRHDAAGEIPDVLHARL